MMRVTSAALCLLTLAVLGGCGGAEPGAEAEGSDVAVEGSSGSTEEAGQTQTQTPSAQPQTPAPESRPRTTSQKPTATKPPATTTRPPAEEKVEPRLVSLTAPAGTELDIKTDGELNTKDNKVGDTFTASVTVPVIDGDRVVIPVGTKVYGQVTAVQKPEGDRPPVLKMEFTQIDLRGEPRVLKAVMAELEPEKKSTKSTGETVGTIGGGAVAGAILGRVIGKDAKGTLIGAAVGAAAGTAVVLATKGSYGSLPEGTPLVLRLEQPITVTYREP